jgi:hypothetical protein
MTRSEHKQRIPALGHIEPHAPLLKIPPGNQLLYKIMTVENLLRSVTGNYLYFNRVDRYSDFQDADPNDGKQLPKDQPANAAAKFVKTPDFSAADYYDQSRARTYACCFSVENSDFIWENYAKGSKKGKVCVVFEFGKLRTMFNQISNPENAALVYEGNVCEQIFSINYGLVYYVDWNNHQTNDSYLSNPILYTYLKDAALANEKELRISLSAIGIGQFALKDGMTIQFPPSLQLAFDFRVAIASAAIRKILLSPDSDSDLITHELSKLRIETAQMPVKP